MKMQRFAILLAAVSIGAAAADMSSFPRQPLDIGDEWTYVQKPSSDGTAAEVTTNYSVGYESDHHRLAILYTRDTGANPRRRNGEEIDADDCIIDVVTGSRLGLERTCSVALPVGKQWRADDASTLRHIQRRYKVLAHEVVEVPAGKFMAIKIDLAWSWADVTDHRSVPMKLAAAKQYHWTYWYAPQVKGMVKMEREGLDSAGASVGRSVTELQAFKKR